MTALTNAQIARQVLQYREHRLDRKRIVYELRRRLGRSWSRAKLRVIDETLRTKAVPDRPKTAARRQSVLADLVPRLRLEKKGRRHVRVQRFAQEPALARAATALRRRLSLEGFRFECVRGDVGMWTDVFHYRKRRGLELRALLTVHERRKPFRLELEVGSF